MTGVREWAALAVVSGVLACGGPAKAGDALYEFQTPTSPDTNGIYRLNTATGEVNFCYWMKVDGTTTGKVACYPAGENAGPQKPGVYGLMRTPYKTDASIYRFDKLAGKVWLCFPDAAQSKTVCAAQQP